LLAQGPHNQQQYLSSQAPQKLDFSMFQQSQLAGMQPRQPFAAVNTNFHAMQQSPVVTYPAQMLGSGVMNTVTPY